jgi:2-hydroxy-6-oxonona-2,4-dienedioate hydrolase
VNAAFTEKTIDIEGLPTRYLTAGSGPPLVLVHGVGTSAGEWSWVLPALARDHLVYAIDLPGFDGSAKSPDYSPAFSARLIGAFLDALRVERTAVIGNSLGGLIALHLALSDPERISALVLSDSAGLGRAVNPVQVALSLPGGGELATTWAKTPPGAAERAFRRGLLLFARPWQIPPKWLKDQCRLAQMPNFMEATLASLRANIGVAGQREVLVDQLPRLRMPTLIVWGVEDRVFPYWQGKEAVTRLQQGSLELIPNCGHLPHVEQPRTFAAIVSRFLGEGISGGEAAAPGPIESGGGKGREEEREEETSQPTISRERTGDDDRTS